MITEAFKNALLALASKAEVQISLYPEGVCKCDELVLDFYEHSRKIKKEDLTPDQNGALSKLDHLLEKYSGKKNEDMYLDESSLFDDPRWEEIRNEAKRVIQIFDWKMDTPKKNESIYVMNDEIIKNK